MPITAIYERTYQLEMDVSGEEVKGEFRGLETEITRRIDLVFSRLPNLYIIPESGLTLKDIVAAVRLCEEGVYRKRTGLIVIDYLSLVRSDRDERDDYVRTARVARGMKDLAIE